MHAPLLLSAGPQTQHQLGWRLKHLEPDHLGQAVVAEEAGGACPGHHPEAVLLAGGEVAQSHSRLTDLQLLVDLVTSLIALTAPMNLVSEIFGFDMTS